MNIKQTKKKKKKKKKGKVTGGEVILVFNISENLSAVDKNVLNQIKGPITSNNWYLVSRQKKIPTPANASMHHMDFTPNADFFD